MKYSFPYILILGFSGLAFAINPAFDAIDAGYMSRARQMSADRNYQGVLDELRHISTEGVTPLPEESEEGDYLRAKALYELEDSRAVGELRRFVADYPASTHTLECMLLIGDYYFYAGDYSAALQEYKRIDIPTLNSTEKNLYSYRKAICLIKRGFYDEARPLIGLLASKSGYKTISQYYEAYLDYVQGLDKQSLEKFKKVAEAQERGNIDTKESLYPEYYIAQLLFRLGEYDDCINVSRNILRKNANGRKPLADNEMLASVYRVLGMSQYEKGNLTAARGSLETYIDMTGDSAGDDALYAAGACEYAAGDYTLASGRFSRLLDLRNEISQGAYLYLGQIAAMEGNSSAAAISFEKAYRMNFDNRVAEAALYNYAAATSRGGNIPFDRSADMLERFVEIYPASEYAPAVERYLGQMYCMKGDYDAAIAVMDKIRRPSDEDKKIFGVILYEAGAAALSERNPKRAASLLKRCIGISPDVGVVAQANIWLGDALYNQGDYREAERAYASALKSGKSGVNYALLNYDMAYALLMQNKFSEASKYFVKAQSASLPTSAMRRDAAMRIADCKYYTGDYSGARADFAELKKSGRGADYAAFRYAQILGITGDIAEKIRDLENFERDFPKSDLIPDALGELADTYASQDNQEKAASVLSRRLLNYNVDASAGDYFNLAEYSYASGDIQSALNAYKAVEQTGNLEYLADARAGIMHSTNDADEKLAYARKLIATPGVAADTLEEAEMLIAEAGLNDTATLKNSLETLKRLADNPFTEAGARSAVILGEHYLASGNPAQAAAVMDKFTSSGSGRQYWIARGFIVLSDAAKAQGDDYLAKEYLKSLRGNYPGNEEDIRRMIDERLRK